MEVQAPYKCFGAFRLLLALTVFFSHSQWLLLPPSVSVPIGKMGLGSVALMVFFVMSGYIISEAADVFYRGRPGAFIANRLLRIFPPYFGALLLSLLAHLFLSRWGLLEKALAFEGYSAAPSEIFTIGTFAHNVTAIFPVLAVSIDRALDWIVVPYDKYPFVRYAWAVNVECVFYLIMFGALWLMCIAKQYQRTALFLLVSAILGKYLFSQFGTGEPTALRFAPYFLLGVVFYHGERFGNVLRGTAIGGLMLMIFMQYSLAKEGEPTLGWGWLRGLKTWEVLVPTLMVVGLSAGIQLLSRVRVQANVKRVDQWLGDLSYSVYLNHFSVLIFVAALSSTSIDLGSAYWFLAFFAVCLVSAMMTMIIEAPMRNIRDGIRRTNL